MSIYCHHECKTFFGVSIFFPVYNSASMGAEGDLILLVDVFYLCVVKPGDWNEPSIE